MNNLHNELPVMTFYTDVKNIHMGGTLSQIRYLWLSFYFVKRVTLFDFFNNKHSRVYKIKT